MNKVIKDLKDHFQVSMVKKIRLGLVFGGRSGEHEVSVRSAKSILDALDNKKYEINLLGVDKSGGWHKIDKQWLPVGSDMKSLPTGEKILAIQEQQIGVFFPIIHGTFGEDGTLQGLFELLNVAYVGAGVLGSAIGMDKDVQKRLLMQAGIPVAKYQVIYDIRDTKYEGQFPCFVKPANMGSSVGISKVNRHEALGTSLKKAFRYDKKVIVEEEVEGRELEVSVLGNDNPIASVPGEVIPKHKFYDYEAKYLDKNGAELIIPAKLPSDKVTEIQELAIRTFKTLECSGMARVDMFLRPNGQLVINEINTLPGFTNISMYPKLWEATGLKYSDLLDKLIELALERKSEKDKLKHSFDGL